MRSNEFATVLTGHLIPYSVISGATNSGIDVLRQAKIAIFFKIAEQSSPPIPNLSSQYYSSLSSRYFTIYVDHSKKNLPEWIDSLQMI